MRCLSLLFILLATVLAFSLSDDSPGPGFFLKVTKNVPRLGRRSESFFTKNSRTIPRIGRRAEMAAIEATISPAALSLLNWINDDTEAIATKSVEKRVMMSGAAIEAAAERQLSMVQPVNSNTLIELLSKDAIPSENVKFVHWKDFDRALQFDMDLYAKIISIGRRPDQRLREDLGFSTYVPVSFFSATNRNTMSGNGNINGAGGYAYNNVGNEVWAKKYERDMLDYNNLK